MLTALLVPTGSLGAAPSPSPAPSPASGPTKGTVSADLGFVKNEAIMTYLSEVITWFRRQNAEAQLVDHPEEVLFFASDQQIAKQVLDLAFAASRAQVALNAKANLSPEQGLAANRSPLLRELAARGEEIDANLSNMRQRVKDLQAQLASAPRNRRATITAELNSATAAAELEGARADAVKQTLQYASGLAAAGQKSNGVLSEIDQLEQSVASTEKGKTADVVVGSTSKRTQQGSTGIIGLTAVYFDLRADSGTLRDASASVNELLGKIEKFKAPAARLIGAISARATELASSVATADPSELRSRTSEYKQLGELHDLAFAVVSPLDKQQVQLELYQENLARWRASIDRYASRALRTLAIRLATLFGLLAIVIAGKNLWRRLVDRYITDQQHRRQLNQLSDPVFWVLIAFVLIVNFATELGSIATIMGFAAAGIALALQNVILSVAGYFFLIGKFGIRVGDRVQIGTTIGDVIGIGLVKLTLMELSPQDRQPTGRVVVYSNAVVFQPNGNFFKQAPGMSFVWNEIRLTLAPDCDYRLAEKRVVDAIDEVFARYRDRVQRDVRYLEANLHVLLENPRPQSRLQLTSSGLDMIVRYPADVRTATQIADEVSRRVLDAIHREPGLQLVAPSPANIQPVAPPTDGAAGEEEPAPANGGQQAAGKT
ncbi:MAG: mechanosensitive ion channel family protein [Deltaproteobacteria bacterium]|nr:mechanosensitive ion channel family protein [Deltaproteobacteria bacterium]